MLPQSRGDGFRRRRHTASPDQVVGLVDHCDRCFLERHVETDILLQFGHETCTSGWRWQGTPTIAALAITPCPYRDRSTAAQQLCPLHGLKPAKAARSGGLLYFIDTLDYLHQSITGAI